jgi:hypothetical protein
MSGIPFSAATLTNRITSFDVWVYNAERFHPVDRGSTAVNGAGQFIKEDLSLDQFLEISL